MNPYATFAELLFTCVDGPIAEVVETVLTGFSTPNQWSRRDAQGQVIRQYFVRPTVHDISAAYVNKAEKSGTVPRRIIFWEPIGHPNKTVMMGHHADGMAHSVFRLSEDSPYTWINVRIYDNPTYPTCCFDYYSNHRRTERRLAASMQEDGWHFIEKGPVQPFENPAYYARHQIQDRLNREIVTEYMRKLGFNIEQEAFWCSEKAGYFLWQERPPLPSGSAAT
jgi:hypothetical protein